MRIKKALQVLSGEKLLWVPPLVGVVAVLIFLATFGFIFQQNCVGKNTESWLTIVTSVLALSYLVGSIILLVTSKDDFESRILLLPICFFLVPFFAASACGIALVITQGIAYGLSPNFESLLLNQRIPKQIASSKLGPDEALIGSATVLGFYIALGIVLEMFTLPNKLVKYIRYRRFGDRCYDKEIEEERK